VVADEDDFDCSSRRRIHSDERDLFRKLTGLEREPGARVEELWLILGRRTGKDVAHPLSPCARLRVSYPELCPGERAEVSCTAVSQRQAAAHVLCGRAGAQIADNGRNGRTSHVQRDGNLDRRELGH